MFCTWCGSYKHKENTCPKLNARLGTSHKYCGVCGKKDHSDENCPRVWGNVRARKLERKRKKGQFDGIDLE